MSHPDRSAPQRRADGSSASIPEGPVRWTLDDDRIATVWFDTPGKPVNTLSAAVWDGLDAALRGIEAARPAGIVFASAKPRSFIAGADLFELRDAADAELDGQLLRGQRILDRIAAAEMPTVAAIAGDALGGGLELALACRFRVAVDDATTRLGLPETTLGLVPGWGGTFRLPRLVGLEPALALLVPGRSIAPAEALAIGLVDRLAPRDEAVTTARRILREPAALARPRRSAEADRAAVLDRFRADVRRRSGTHLPAPLRLIDIVAIGVESGAEAGAAAERRGLLDLRRTAAGENLLRLFFLRTAAKKRAAAAAGGSPRPVRRAVVIGGGTMGAGIAAALATAGVTVEIVEADAAAAARVAGAPAAVPVTTDWAAIAAADLVVEAVSEDLGAKREVFRRLDATALPEAVLASNTSSLSIAALADVVRHPARVIGLHFFNPVRKMPLVEVVRSAASAADAVATGVAVAALVGKTPIVCTDAPGFVVNRVLFRELREALVHAAAGVDLTAVDAAARSWGLPMGPFALLDEIGLDVARSIFRSLAAALGPRFDPPNVLDGLLDRGWLGRKSGRGFYVHPPEGRPQRHADWEAARPGALSPGTVDEAAVERWLIGPMADEARLVLGDGVVADAATIDLATVLGIGFPAFRGGLATHAGLAGDG